MKRLELGRPAISNPQQRQIAEIQVPTLVSYGDLDQPDMPLIAEKLVTDIPGA